MSSELPIGEHGQPGPLDPSSARLQILSTEHWSLLATRSLTYTESFSRVSMFLGVLSGAVIALALLAQVGSLNRAFSLVAILILSVVIFFGVATVGRLTALNREDGHWIMAMNRVRRGYLEMHPELEPYFATSSHDDMPGVLLTMGSPMTVLAGPSVADAWHGMTTLPAMVSVIVSVVAGVWAALIAGALGFETTVAVVVAVAAFLATVVTMGFFARRSFMLYIRGLRPVFPSPTATPGDGSNPHDPAP